jgi:hypothetical protein
VLLSIEAPHETPNGKVFAVKLLLLPDNYIPATTLLYEGEKVVLAGSHDAN